MKVLQEVPAIQQSRTGARGRGALGDAPLERVDVDLEGLEIESYGVAANDKCPWAGAKRLAERRERLSQALSGLDVCSGSPQEGCESFPGTWPAREKCEVCEQGHGLLRDVERPSGNEMSVHSTQQRQAQQPHSPYTAAIVSRNSPAVSVRRSVPRPSAFRSLSFFHADFPSRSRSLLTISLPSSARACRSIECIHDHQLHTRSVGSVRQTGIIVGRKVWLPTVGMALALLALVAPSATVEAKTIGCRSR